MPITQWTAKKDILTSLAAFLIQVFVFKPISLWITQSLI